MSPSIPSRCVITGKSVAPRQRLRLAAFLAASVVMGSVCRGLDEFGEFSGDVVTKFIEDDGESRKMQLLENFTYIDPRGKKWAAPKDSVIDGASIPQAFWTLIGGPFEGPYRRASVVHDVVCEKMTERWEDVHLMFYEACRCGGVGEVKAKVMYYAVHHFGPRWMLFKETKVIDGENVTVWRGRRTYASGPDKIDVRKLEERIAAENPSLDELRAMRPE